MSSIRDVRSRLRAAIAASAAVQRRPFLHPGKGGGDTPIRLLVDRRCLLAGAVAAGAATALPGLAPRRASADGLPPGAIELIAGPAEARLVTGDYAPTPVWAYGATVPGPEIRLKQGQEATIRVVNHLDQPTTVHWHGLRIANAMDGAAGLTQDAISAGDRFDYAFTPPDAGTYWYHPHNRTWEQLARGLYGLLVVEEAEPPRVDRELPFLVDDWRLDEAARIDEASLGRLMDWSHGGRLGNLLTVNGGPPPEIPVRRGERLRLRMVNAANARIFVFDFGGLAPTLVAVDGQPVSPASLPGGRLTLAPAQRADLILDVGLEPGAGATIDEIGNGRPYAVARLVADPGDVLRESPLDAPVGLPDNPLPSGLARAGALAVDLHMEGGAMGRMTGATLDGERLDIRALAGRGHAWAFNGVAGMPEAPLVRVARGRTVLVRMINDTAWPHAMHLHGHHFRVVERGGQAVALAPWRDTELVERGEAVTIAFVADNPGKWLLHCHMIEHQAAGMATWIDVA